MGAPVGAGVGLAVGPAVGDVVGASVGMGEGDALGDTDGAFVGVFVGAKVGEREGADVGEPVGVSVGDGVGASVGDAVGPRVGALVGKSVGYGVGRLVGAFVGAGVGDVVGDSVHDVTAVWASSSWCCPCGQLVHSLTPASEPYLPAGHLRHSIPVQMPSCSLGLSWYLPIVQGMHDASDWPPLTSLYLPAAHLAQDSAEPYCPAGQLGHASPALGTGVGHGLI